MHAVCHRNDHCFKSVDVDLTNGIMMSLSLKVTHWALLTRFFGEGISSSLHTDGKTIIRFRDPTVPEIHDTASSKWESGCHSATHGLIFEGALVPMCVCGVVLRPALE